MSLLDSYWSVFSTYDQTKIEISEILLDFCFIWFLFKSRRSLQHILDNKYQYMSNNNGDYKWTLSIWGSILFLQSWKELQHTPEWKVSGCIVVLCSLVIHHSHSLVSNPKTETVSKVYKLWVELLRVTATAGYNKSYYAKSITSHSNRRRLYIIIMKHDETYMG
jgi:hypothetical protein